ncbi:octanoyltransferase [Aureimonas sp. SA4125]|uniref:lipoyl(octanoyl) transferase LipB n=1 Tax=Aureimonas sp. SA4125 TaxID=2826993 RepID=UPI001CC3EBA1|nr:lipoyl(octanoyl) transferase LipB [Aureimonas sp. SA4125]BDA84759.1 octanoyltransferase [Aureimonas sp. SA4125]
MSPLPEPAETPVSPRLAVSQERFLASTGSPAVEWTIWPGLTPYADAVAFMDERVAGIAEGIAPETILLLEHPALYTAGTRADAADLVDPDRFPVHASGRGGEYTYHGPGQRVAYVMLDLKRRRPDVRAFVSALEHWIIATLGDFQVRGERREDRVGVWVRRPERPCAPDGSMAEDKIAAIGIRLRKWVTFHGISLNVDPDLGHFSGIVPCGVSDHGVTSLVDLGLPVSMAEVDGALRRQFERVFGPTRPSSEIDEDR